MILESEQEQKNLINQCDLALKNCGIKIYPFVDFLLKNTKLQSAQEFSKPPEIKTQGDSDGSKPEGI